MYGILPLHHSLWIIQVFTPFPGVDCKPLLRDAEIYPWFPDADIETGPYKYGPQNEACKVRDVYLR